MSSVALSDVRKRWTRDGVLRIVGILGIIHETLITKGERPSLLILFGGMVGLPSFFNKDEKNQVKEGGSDVDQSRSQSATGRESK